MIQIKHFRDYLYSGDKEIPCGEALANEWLEKHPEIVVKDVQTQIMLHPKYQHEYDEMHITIIYEVPDKTSEKQK